MSKQDIKFAISTITVAIILVVAGFIGGYAVASISNRDATEEYLRGLHEGQYAADRTLYATCEDEMIASQYPSGFCEGVSDYLGV